MIPKIARTSKSYIDQKYIVRTGTGDKVEERIRNFIDTGLLANHQEP